MRALIDLLSGETRRREILLRAEFQQLSTLIINECAIAKANGRSFKYKADDDVLSIEFILNSKLFLRKYYPCELSHQRMRHFIKWLKHLNFLGEAA